MSDINAVRASIEKALAGLRKEQQALEAALAALGGVEAAPRRGRGRPKGSTSAARKAGSSGRRGRRSSRPAEALALVKAQPGVTIPAMAKEMDIAAPYLYRVMPKLVEEGKVRKDGSGWFPADGAPAAAAPEPVAAATDPSTEPVAN
ncbi:MAG: hypothetical protein QOG62_851 [Thermoleophilaceae bacterium]|nr:hypothetical protein [Thermoleophilaceae bacterium]